MNRLKYLIATLGGFQFGYAIGVMAGAILFITPELSLAPDQEGLAVSVFLIGAIFGTLVAGLISNKIGRKYSQQLLAAFFIVGTFIILSASSLSPIVIGRIFQGLAAGGFTIVGPMYLAEVSPAASRGFYVSCYQLAVTLGILIAFTVGWTLSFSGAWKTMFAIGLIPAFTHLIGFCFLPDSTPKQIEPHSSWKKVLEFRSSLLIAILINVFQQVSGINAILYFVPSIFQASGFTSPSSALLPSMLIGLINFMMTIVAAFLLDKWGRRPLLLVGTAAMVVSLMGLVVVFLDPTTAKWLSTLSIMVYIAGFAVGLGPMPQLLGTELFPRSIRAQAMSIGGLSNYIFNFLVVYTFIGFTTRLSHAGTFALYAVFGILALFYIWKFIPETKGREID